VEKKQQPKKKEEKKEESESDSDESDNSDLSNGSNEIVQEGLNEAQQLLTGGRILRSKGGAMILNLTDHEQRKKNQAKINEALVKELKVKHRRGEFNFAVKKEKVKEMDKYEAYKSASEFPADLRPGQLYVDMDKHCVLVPNTPTTFIPFHISTIKSCSETT